MKNFFLTPHLSVPWHNSRPFPHGQVSGCRVCPRVLSGSEGSGEYTCGRCAQADELLSLLAELREEVGRLRSTRESEKVELYSAILGTDASGRPSTRHGGSPTLSPSGTRRGSQRRGDGSPFLLGAAGESPPCLPRLPRCPDTTGCGANGDTNDDVDEGPSRLQGLPRASQPSPSITTTSIEKTRRVMVTGDSLLRKTEGRICQTTQPMGKQQTPTAAAK